jgi:hypothetical protein
MATRRTFTGVNPGQMFTPEEAYSTVTGYGIPLDANMERAKTLAGWSGTGPVSGEGLNRVIQTAAGEMDADFTPYGQPAAPPPMTPPAAPGVPAPMAPMGGGFPALTGPGQYPGLDPNTVYDPNQVINWFGSMIGQDFNPYVQEAIGIAMSNGWGGGSDPLYGRYLNPIVQEIQRRMTGAAPGGGPVPGGGAPGDVPPFGPGNPSGTPPLRDTTQRPTNSGLIPPGNTSAFRGDLVPVGEDPLSAGITQRLLDMLQYEGSTAFGDDIARNLLGLIRTGGSYEGETRNAGEDLATALNVLRSELESPDSGNAEFEAAREMNERGRRASIKSARGELASRGLLSEPGIPQGAETGAIGRIEEGLGADFASALRDISIDRGRRRSGDIAGLVQGAGQLSQIKQQDRAALDQRMLTALQLATGMSADQANTLIKAVGEGTSRQDALAKIALMSLEQNQSWARFLAEHGLERDKVMYEIQNGNLTNYIPLLQSFLQVASLSRGGYI